MKLYAIVGAGGFGREVMPVAREIITLIYGNEGIEFVFVVESLVEEKTINGYRVISEKDFISTQANEKYFNIAIADYRVRERIANKLIKENINPFSIQSFNTVIYDNNDIGEGAIFSPFTTVTSNATIGKFFHCNIYSYVAHDCVIGDFVTFAPRVCCNGRVVVEDYAYIGTGAVIRHGTNEHPIIIGKGSIVGMGAVVTKSVPPFTTVIGNPAAEFKKGRT